MLCQCGRNVPEVDAIVWLCSCGKQHQLREQFPIKSIDPNRPKQTRCKPTFSPVNINANICRLCPSGRYDREHDACIEVIEIGLSKGRRRAGKINFLHRHPAEKCPLGHF